MFGTPERDKEGHGYKYGKNVDEEMENTEKKRELVCWMRGNPAFLWQKQFLFLCGNSLKFCSRTLRANDSYYPAALC